MKINKTGRRVGVRKLSLATPKPKLTIGNNMGKIKLPKMPKIKGY